MTERTRGRLSDAAAARTFVLAGRAVFTLVSLRTGTRFTFRVRRPSSGAPVHHVGLLTGPDNRADYEYLGTVHPGGDYRPGRRSRVGPDAPGARAFEWFWRTLPRTGALPAGLEFWHEGKCCRCGRALTVPESVASGVGPECARKTRERRAA